MGQNATTGPPKYVLTRRLLHGDALAAFEAGAAAAGAETNVHFTQAVNSLIEHVFPSRALAIQKRVMRRNFRKPKEMTTRTFMARLVEINNYLSQFPPFNGDDQKMDEEELLDIGEYAVPSSWQRQMVMHDYDPTEGTTQDLVAFCKRIEQVEQLKDLDAPIPKKKPVKSDDSNRAARPKKWCDYCETRTHNTRDCYKLRDLKRKSDTPQHSSRDYDKRPRNNTWKKNTPRNRDETYLNKEQAMALIDQVVKKHYGANKSTKAKRKRKTEELAVAELESQAEAFANLSLSSSDSDSSSQD